MKEHLQEIIFEKNTALASSMKRISELESENRGLVDLNNDLIRDKDRLEAEIERLKEELPECQMCATINSSDGWYCAECAGAWDVKTVKDAEIERLKGELDCCSQHSTTQVRVVRDLHARLAAAVECAEGYTDILWTMEINDFANEILDKLRGES